MTKLITLDPKEKEIIDYIKGVRLKKGITQDKLANMAKVSRSLINLSEIYTQKYSKKTLKKLFNSLGLEPPKEEGLADKFDSIEVDLFPGVLKSQKTKIILSDNLIENIDSLKELQFTNKGALLIDGRELFEPFKEDFQSNSQDYYAVILNDDSLVPFALKGDYLILKFRDKYFFSSNKFDDSRMKMYLIEDFDKKKVFRYIKSVYNFPSWSNKKNERLLYAFYAYHMPNNVVGAPIHVVGDFYFREKDGIKIIGEVVAAIKPKVMVTRF